MGEAERGDTVKYRSMVSWSGGAASYVTARLWLQEQESERETVALVFADTRAEDEDLYRFMDDAQRRLNHPVIRLAEGRTPWAIFFDEGLIGNTQKDPCSRILKRELLRKWRDENCEPDATLVIGFDANEEHRLETAKLANAPFQVRAPLIEQGIWKEEVKAMVRADGLKLSRLYDLGFSHDNCGGGCIKGGQGHWTRLLETIPDRYAYHEGEERRFRQEKGKDVSILRDRRGGKTHSFTLEQLRQRHQKQPSLIDRTDIGGCGCNGAM